MWILIDIEILRVLGIDSNWDIKSDWDIINDGDINRNRTIVSSINRNRSGKQTENIHSGDGDISRGVERDIWKAQNERRLFHDLLLQTKEGHTDAA